MPICSQGRPQTGFYHAGQSVIPFNLIERGQLETIGGAHVHAAVAEDAQITVENRVDAANQATLALQPREQVK